MLPLFARFYLCRHIWDSACFPKQITCSSSHPFYDVLTTPELLVMFDMIWMNKRLKYLPAHVIHILVCGFGSVMTRNTVYRRMQNAERDINYLQVRECIPCMNEYQGRNNGWAEMSKLMLNLGAQPNTHTHTLMKLNTVESDLKLLLAKKKGNHTHTEEPLQSSAAHMYQTDDQTWPQSPTTHAPNHPHKTCHTWQ